MRSWERRAAKTILGLACLAGAFRAAPAPAQTSVVIDSLSGDGQLTWTAPTNASCTIEWASSLTSRWSSSWGQLTELVSSNGSGRVPVPMYYRVKYNTEELEAFRFVESLLCPCGLVLGRRDDCYTTVYKNSLAAMVFLHQGQTGRAERIFSFFQAYATNQPSYSSMPMSWNACSGVYYNTNSTVGDDAFLLLALNYYAAKCPESHSYTQLVRLVKQSLIDRAPTTPWAEWAANAFAALSPYRSQPGVEAAMQTYWRAFTNDVHCSNVLDHTVRGCLVFGDTSGFACLHRFDRTNTWAYDHATVVRGLSDFEWDTGGDTNINVEISAQILLTWSLWKSTTSYDGAWLAGELQKLRLPGSVTNSAGHPYYVSARAGDWSPPAYAVPVIDPTIYLLFYFWGFNPFAPGQRCATFCGEL